MLGSNVVFVDNNKDEHLAVVTKVHHNPNVVDLFIYDYIGSNTVGKFVKDEKETYCWKELELKQELSQDQLPAS